jgi:HTH-type transcriptional regulator / antitoxin HipB
VAVARLIKQTIGDIVPCKRLLALRNASDTMHGTMQLRTPRDIGALIRAHRRALGLDQRALAARAGVSRLWIGEVERGKPGASLGLVLRVLASLGVTLSTSGDPAADTAPGAAPPPIGSPDINAIVNAARRR